MSLSGSVVQLNKFQYILIQDEKSPSTDGGDFNSGAWRTRDLNTIKVDETSSVSVSSNQFTLPAGTYICSIQSPSYNVGRNRNKLVNITDSSDVLFGSSEEGGYTSSVIKGKFSIGSSKTFEIQHKAGSSQSSNGLGSASQVGGSEIYTIVELWKVSTINVLAVEC